jgi:hypothetical protein
MRGHGVEVAVRGMRNVPDGIGGRVSSDMLEKQNIAIYVSAYLS